MNTSRNKISTGIEGLDEILDGGLLSQKAYLLKGGPGTGKSIMGFHFLGQGITNGEETLLITLGEAKDSVIENASKVGLDMSEVEILDLSPQEEVYKNAEMYEIFPPSEVETPSIVQSIVEKVESLKPSRVVLDSVTMLKHLFQDTFQYRNLALSFIRYITSQGATFMLISESDSSGEDQEPFWVDGVFNLKYTKAWRKIEIPKYRGSDFRSGSHAFKITSDGIQVFPRLQPNKYDRKFADTVLSFNVTELDEMTNGGLEKGTITMLTGPTGVGKTSLGVQFIKAAATRDERSVIYTFEESANIIKRRSKGINVPIDDMLENENLRIIPIEPLSYSPDEFAGMVRHDVETNRTSVLMIDTVSAYCMSAREENPLQRLHSLCVYLQNMGVTVLLINELNSITGEFIASDLNASYLADNIIFLRYLELDGELKRVTGVLKKRLSSFEQTIREFKITPDGIKIGKPLENMQGILSGQPNYNN